MHHTPKILSILLALLLFGSNIAFSGHVSSHAPTGSGVCSICIHPGGGDGAIIPDVGTIELTQFRQRFRQSFTAPVFYRVSSHNHQSRAPPVVT